MRNAYTKMHLGDLGTHDGEPISKCPSFERYCLDARLGSEALKKAIDRVGVRP